MNCVIVDLGINLFKIHIDSCASLHGTGFETFYPLTFLIGLSIRKLRYLLIDIELHLESTKKQKFRKFNPYEEQYSNDVTTTVEFEIKTLMKISTQDEDSGHRILQERYGKATVSRGKAPEMEAVFRPEVFGIFFR
jgi:hypothetical protein